MPVASYMETRATMDELPGQDAHTPASAKPQMGNIMRGLALAASAAAVVLLLWLLGDVLLPFLVGAAVAYFLDPAVRRLEGAGVPRVMASLGMMLLLFGLLLTALIWLVPLVVSEAAALSRALPSIFEDAKDWVDQVTNEEVDDEDSTISQILTDAGDALRENAQTLAMGLLSGVNALIGLILFWVVMPVVAFYLLMDWPRLLAAIDSHLPRDHAPTIRRLAAEIDRTLAGFVRGEVIVCTVLAAYYSILLTLLGLTYGLVIGLVAGLVSFIPYVGAFIGGGLSIGFALYQFWGDPWWIGAVVAVFVIGQFMESQVLVPRLVGHSVNLHPVWLIFAIMAFGALFGLLGVLVAVPVAAALGVLVRFALARYRESRLFRGRSGVLPPR